MAGMMEKIPSYVDGSVCLNCMHNEPDRCPMLLSAREHLKRMLAYNTEDYSYIDPEGYDEWATDFPDFAADAIIWCPWFGDEDEALEVSDE